MMKLHSAPTGTLARLQARSRCRSAAFALALPLAGALGGCGPNVEAPGLPVCSSNEGTGFLSGERSLVSAAYSGRAFFSRMDPASCNSGIWSLGIGGDERREVDSDFGFPFQSPDSRNLLLSISQERRVPCEEGCCPGGSPRTIRVADLGIAGVLDTGEINSGAITQSWRGEVLFNRLYEDGSGDYGMDVLAHSLARGETRTLLAESMLPMGATVAGGIVPFLSIRDGRLGLFNMESGETTFLDTEVDIIPGFSGLMLSMLSMKTDGRHVAVSGHDSADFFSIQVYRADGSFLREINDVQKDMTFFRSDHLFHGNYIIAVMQAPGAGEYPSIIAVDVESGTERQIADPQGDFEENCQSGVPAAFSSRIISDGRYLFVETRADFDTGGGEYEFYHGIKRIDLLPILGD